MEKCIVDDDKMYMDQLTVVNAVIREGELWEDEKEENKRNVFFSSAQLALEEGKSGFSFAANSAIQTNRPAMTITAVVL